MTALSKFVAGAVALAALLWLGYCGIQRAARNAMRDEIKQAALRDTVVIRDSIFAADTFRLRVARTHYDTLRRRLVITDTVRVREVLAAADSTIVACGQALSSCNKSILARDLLIRELEKGPHVPRVSYVATLAYEPLLGTALLRGGPELRLFWGISALAEGEARQESNGIRGAVRVGVQKRF